MFFGLHESLKMIEEEGLDAVFQRHARLGEATRAAVRAWGDGGKGPHALRPDARPALRSGDDGDDARGRELRSHAQGRRSTASTCRWAAGWGR